MQAIDTIRNGSPFYLNIPQQKPQSFNHIVPTLDFSDAKSLFHSSKSRIFGYSELGKKVHLISTKPTLEQADIQILVEAFKSKEYFKVRHLIAKILAKQSPEDANVILKAIFKAHTLDDTKTLFQKLGSLFTLQKIEQAVHSEFGGFKGALNTAIEISQTAKRNIDATEITKAATLKSHVQYYLSSTVEWIVDSILLVLQLTDVTDNDATKMERQMVAQMRYMAFRDNIAILSAWLIGLALYTGSILTTAMIASVTTAIALTALIIYKNFLKPCPDNVHPGKNRTSEASKGNIAPIYGREETVKKLFDTLEGNTKTRARRYPMIRGGTGIGKSDLGNAMAMYLASPDCPKEWKGKKLFVVSTADIVTGGAHGKMEHLHHIKDVLEGHEEKAILFFTEVHVGFQEKFFFLGQELKTMCDAPGGFPYMVFATTEKEYMDHIAQDPAFARRLEFFDIKPTSDEVTELIVSDMVAREASDILVSNEAIKEVATVKSQFIDIDGDYINVFEDCPQPSTSIAITAKALAHARHPWFKEHETALQELKNHRNLLDHQLKMERGANYLPYSDKGNDLQERLQKLDEQIAAKEKVLSDADFELDQFRALVKKTTTLQDEIEKIAVQIKKTAEKDKVSEKDLKRFILLLNFMKPAMDECLKELSQQVENANAIINVDVMRDFIKQEARAYLRKAQEKEISFVA